MSLPQSTIRPTRRTAGRSGRHHRRPALLAGAAAAIAALALAPAGAAVAAPAAAPVPLPGQVTLYTGPNATGFPQVVRYAACESFSAPVTRPVASFVNNPLPGCEVVLVSGVRSFELCVGQANLPVLFPAPVRLVTRPGTSPRCMVA